MSLYMDSSLRAAFREVLAWEQQNPKIAARDAAVATRRAEKVHSDLIKTVTAPVTRTPRHKGKFSPHSSTCLHCHVTYWKSHHSRAYCSSSCQVAAGRTAEKDKAPSNAWRTPRTCATCSCEFMPEYPGSKTCSEACHKKRLAESARALYEAKNARRREARQKGKVEK